LLAGQLARELEAGGRVGVVLEDDANAVVGGAVFHPHFPGAYPFRVTRPDLALPLLRAIRPHARPTDTSVNVMVDVHLDVAAALVAAGAIVRLEVVHMKGPIPETALEA